MTDLVETDNGQYTASQDLINVPDISETSPLLNSIESRRSVLEYIWIICLALIFIIGVSIGTYLLFAEGELTPSKKLFLVRKERWNTLSSVVNIPKLTLPTKSVLLLQTNTSGCWNESECCRILRSLQKEHIEQLNEPDILYNFIVGGDGRVYEGRGWEYQSSYRDSDKEVLTVAFLGNYNKYPPSQQQSEELEAFLDYAVMRKKLIPCYKILVLNYPMRYFKDIAFRIEETVKKENRC